MNVGVITDIADRKKITVEKEKLEYAINQKEMQLNSNNFWDTPPLRAQIKNTEHYLKFTALGYQEGVHRGISVVMNSKK